MRKGRLKNSLCLWLAVAQLGLGPQMLFGQSYSQGLILYQKGRVQQAEDVLKKAEKSAKNAGEKVEIYKLLGIVQYMQGNKSGAAQSFAQCLAIDPKQSISAGEVLDETVIPFFESIKASRGSGANAAAAAAPAATHERAHAEFRYGRQVKTTILIVQSNVRASVYIDEILAGSSGAPLEIKEGKIEVAVQANGYRAQKQILPIRAKYENILTVTLAKDEPRGAKSSAVVVAGGSRKSAKDDMFADEEPDYNPKKNKGKTLVDEFNEDSASAALVAKPASRVKPKANKTSAVYPNTVRNSSGGKPKTNKPRGPLVAKGSPFVAILPFGIGQFQNNDPLFGLLFASSELASLFVFVKSNQEAQSSESILLSLKEEETASPGTDPYRQDDIRAQEAYISQMKTQANFSLGLFAILLIAGATEAYMNRPMVRRSVSMSLPEINGGYNGYKSVSTGARPVPVTFHQGLRLLDTGNKVGWTVGVDF